MIFQLWSSTAWKITGKTRLTIIFVGHPVPSKREVGQWLLEVISEIVAGRSACNTFSSFQSVPTIEFIARYRPKCLHQRTFENWIGMNWLSYAQGNHMGLRCTALRGGHGHKSTSFKKSNQLMWTIFVQRGTP